jgi:hypothetical protein
MIKNILNKTQIGFVIFVLISIISCDSGDIYPKEKTGNRTGIDVTANFQFMNPIAFPESYKIIFGSFNENSIYPISSKLIAKPSSNDILSVTLSNIPENASYLALYLVQEHGNSQIHPFYIYPIEKSLDADVELPLQEINLATFERLQKQVFTQCVQCHGGSGFAAAGLYLTGDKSYSGLVNSVALHNPEKKLVSPNNTLNSFLIDILKGEALENQHSSLSSLKNDDIVLTEQWIKTGADNN